MKLHNLLLTAALFVTAAAAFAGAKTTKDYDDYTWFNGSKKNVVEVTLTKFNNQNGFKYAVYDVDALERITAEVNADASIKDNKKSGVIAERMKGYIWDLKAKKNGSAVTTITLPKDATAVRFGVIEYNHSVYSVPNVSDSQFHFYTLGDTPANVVLYGKPGKGGGNDKSAQISFGAPLPTPVVTLLIALAFGAGFVMYRNRKQAKA